mmetsp:Transcript_24632/g.45290  ORF Transcript_24632/g.45290 Transcript_24632/m.45290 type:complete len:115 (+) Transcript_24632:708-1052(+)
MRMTAKHKRCSIAVFSARRRYHSTDPSQDPYTHHHSDANTTVKQQKTKSLTLLLVPSDHNFMAAATDADRNIIPYLEAATLVAKSGAAYDLKYHQNVENSAALDTVNTGYLYGL